MIAIYGANGRTGAAILKEAIRRKLEVRPIVRDDRDTDHLPREVDLQSLCFSDPTVRSSLAPVLKGCEQVIICVDPRTSGPGATMYPPEAVKNIIEVATEEGVKLSLYISVMGGYRWSYASLNRRAFYLESAVRDCDAPWSMMRVSCYHDEVIEGHIAPPDGAAPHKLKKRSRYTPISREELASVVLDSLDKALPGRSVCLGGPQTLSTEELEGIVRQHSRGRGRRTTFAALPPGDVSVDPDTTRRSIGYVPSFTLEEMIAGTSFKPPARDFAPVYARVEPGPHSSDMGKEYKVLAPLEVQLRRVVHAQLTEDLERLGVSSEGVVLDFSRARGSGRSERAHDGVMRTISGVKVMRGDEELHRGRVSFVRDSLAEIFRCWWGDEMPESVWLSLDVGVQRRVKAHPAFADDPVVQG